MQLVTKDPNAFTTAITKTAGNLFRTGTLLEAATNLMDGGKIPEIAAQSLSPCELDRMVREIVRQSNKRAERHLAKASQSSQIEERILSILLAGSFTAKLSLQPKKGDSESTPEAIRGEILSRIGSFTARQAPLIFALVLGGTKARVGLKTGSTTLPDLAEWFAWARLEALAVAIGSVYGPGAKFFAIPDGPLYSPDFAAIADCDAHIRQSAADVKLLGLRHITIPFSTSWIDGEWEQAVQELLPAAERGIAGKPKETAEHLESLYASVDSFRLGLNYEAAVLTYTAIAAKLAEKREVKAEDKSGLALKQQLLSLSPALPESARSAAEEIMAQARLAKPRYDAVNFAIRQTQLLERIIEHETGSREYVRLSVHAKPYELQPQFFDASHLVKTPTLLPMHSIGFSAVRGENYEIGPAFHLDARMRSWVPMGDATGRILWYSAPASVR